MAKSLGADFGYQTVRVVIPEEGAVIRSEPAVVAISLLDGTVVACGEDAMRLSRTVPGSVRLLHPFGGESATEAVYWEAYFCYLIDVLRKKGAHLTLSFAGQRGDEVEAVAVEAAERAGFKTVTVIDAVFAAAQGCGVTGVGDAAVVNIGASTTDLCCFRRAAPSDTRSVPFAGNAFDRTVIGSVLQTYRYRLTHEEGEKLKRTLASLTPQGDRTAAALAIRPTLGLPKRLTLREEEISNAIEPVFASLSDEILAMIRKQSTPPEKVILTGGGAKLDGLAPALASLLCLPVEVANEPENAVIRGLSVLMGAAE